jgi:uncharacterized protein YjbI with pentapeptide repeats
LEGSKTNLCIFHAPNEEKKPTDFWEAFVRLYEKTVAEFDNADPKGKRNIKLNCARFVFPRFVIEAYFPRKVHVEASFLGANFEYGADFSQVVFYEDAFFSGAFFGGELNEREKAEERVNRNRALEVEAFFYGAEFRKSGMFNRTHFYCPAIFTAVKQGGRVKNGLYFLDSEFHDEFRISECDIKGDADFYGTTFEKNAEIVEATFHEDAIFAGTTFKGDAKFHGAEFYKKGIFDSTTFEKKIFLVGVASRFEKDDDGRRLYERGRGKIVDPEAEVYLRNCDFLPGSKLVVDRTVLKKFSFANTRGLEDFRIADFKGGVWKKPEEKRKVVYDEVLARRGGEDDPTYEDAADVYRRLRLNYETRLAYEAASDFHIGQMEMLLENPATSKLKKSFLWWYKWVSNFGESVGRPLIWFAGLWLLFAVVWFFSGFPYNGGSVNFDLTWPWLISANLEMAKDIEHSLLYSFKTFLTLPDLKGGVVSQTIGAVQRLAGVSVITLFILALRRAFRR